MHERTPRATQEQMQEPSSRLNIINKNSGDKNLISIIKYATANKIIDDTNLKLKFAKALKKKRTSKK